MTSGVARGRLLLTRLPERPFRPADPRTANRAFQQRRQFDRATPLSDRGDFGAAFWARAGQNTPLAGAGYPHSPSLRSGGAARRPRRNSQHIVRRNRNGYPAARLSRRAVGSAPRHQAASGAGSHSPRPPRARSTHNLLSAGPGALAHRMRHRHTGTPASFLPHALIRRARERGTARLDNGRKP